MPLRGVADQAESVNSTVTARHHCQRAEGPGHACLDLGDRSHPRSQHRTLTAQATAQSQHTRHRQRSECIRVTRAWISVHGDHPTPSRSHASLTRARCHPRTPFGKRCTGGGRRGKSLSSQPWGGDGGELRQFPRSTWAVNPGRFLPRCQPGTGDANRGTTSGCKNCQHQPACDKYSARGV